jgi:hypothetical protein
MLRVVATSSWITELQPLVYMSRIQPGIDWYRDLRLSQGDGFDLTEILVSVL